MNEVDLGVCVGCPIAQECLGRITALTAMKEVAVNIAMHPQLDARSDELFDFYRQVGILPMVEAMEGTPIESPEHLLLAVRKITATGLERFDGDIEAEQTKLTTMTSDCEGVLKMRAKKAGRTVTVAVCNSPQKTDGHSHETVIVDRSGGK